MKNTMKEYQLNELNNLLLKDLLKIRSKLYKRIIIELEKNTTPYNEIDYSINRLMTINEKIETEITKRLRVQQLKRMYNK